MRSPPPNLPLPPAEYSKEYMQRLTRDIELYFLQLASPTGLMGTTLRLTNLTGASTLVGAILAGDTSIDLVDATKFPDTGSGTIDQTEKFSWTGKTGSTLTGVTRGILGTTATGHAGGSVVVASAVPGMVYADPTNNALYVVV